MTLNSIRKRLAAPLLFVLVAGSVPLCKAQEPPKPEIPAATEKPPVGEYAVDFAPDIAYNNAVDADPKKQKLDLYTPKGLKDFPVALFIHGGAWSTGDRKMYGRLGQIFASRGIGAVIVSYRLSPGVKHPSHIEDVAKAFAWTHKNIARYGGRADQIYVTGQSAGGHLAALLATNPKYLKAEGLSPQDIKGVMPISGVYAFRTGLFDRVLGEGPEVRLDASPLSQVTGKESPFLILYADKDFRGCDAMSKSLDESLRAKGVESSCVEIADRNHISIIVRALVSDLDPTTRKLIEFIKEHSKEKAVASKGQ